MIEITFDLSDIERLADKIDGAMSKALDLTTQAIAADAKPMAPIRTGQLRASIKSLGVIGQFSGNSLVGTVGAGAPYAGYVNFGTRFMKAQPFLTAELHKEKAAQIFADNIESALEQ